MRRQTFSRLKVMLVLLPAIVVPEQAFGPASMQGGQQTPPPPPVQATTTPPAQPVQIPLDLFKVPDGFEVTLWAATPPCRTSVSCFARAKSSATSAPTGQANRSR